MDGAAAAGLATACRGLGVPALAGLAAGAGITRLADLTGVDRLGICVVQAARPAGRSLSVAMGKGADLAAAATGAIMEGVEHDCAERAVASTEARPASAMPAGAAALAARLGLAPGTPVAWMEGVDLAGSAPALVPFPAVSLDFTRAERTGIRVRSNGLAAGATRDAALLAAACELVERDRFAWWLHADPLARAGTAVDLASIEEPACRTLADRIARAGCTLLLWDLAAPGGLPVCAAAIADGDDGRPVLPPAFGIAARFDPAAAARAAIEEAAQTRAGLIAGARDDLRPDHYAAPEVATARMLLETLALLPARRPFAAAGPPAPTDAAGRLRWLVARIAARGGPVVAIDLTRSELGIPVVKLIAPALAAVRSDRAPLHRAA